MARNKAAVLLIALLIASGASALEFEVSVDDELSASTFRLNYSNQTQNFQEVSFFAKNTGSVGCTFRSRLSVNGTENIYSYSQPHELWPSEITKLEAYHIPRSSRNSTANVTLHYCGKQKDLGRIQFETGKPDEAGLNITTRTMESNSSAAFVKLNISDARLIPVEKPPQWKVSHAEVRNGSAVIEYDAPIFDTRESIEYAVVNSGEGKILSRVRIGLEPNPTLLYRLKQQRWKVAAVGLLMVNLGLLAFALRRSVAKVLNQFVQKLKRKWADTDIKR